MQRVHGQLQVRRQGEGTSEVQARLPLEVHRPVAPNRKQVPHLQTAPLSHNPKCLIRNVILR